ncbi:AzlC family ABC transporter permease [Oceanicoccus sagamiensis]|uniref:AzlC family ABC transporter permease n=1 Tax=Oceanicoccus sagamiensis TaxID=716816 RepID=UPI0019819F86|nr:AzlC family ABC transporter permease [Oceanicoccus sagamiensis]
MRGAIIVFPLTLSVIPWGILAGSYALEVGLSPLESQAMSAIIFGGAVQLAVLGMLSAGAGLLSLLITAALITSRHLLYSMSMRSSISLLPLRWRLVLGFLLTDELFAITPQGPPKAFNRWQALGGGLTFYVGWNTATLLGIVAGQSIPNLDEWG